MLRLKSKIDHIRQKKASNKDFIIADAKDADMGFGITAPGKSGKSGFASLDVFLQQVRDIVAADAIDICLLSASNLERLTEEGIFKNSQITTAVRGNDSTDIWKNRFASYTDEPSKPHRAVNLRQASDLGCHLCLYSVTFMGCTETDLETLNAFSQFRRDAHEAGMSYFLEVFNPNINKRSHRETGAFVNDCIVRTLAPLMRAERPQFLKIVYNGRESLRELVNYDSNIVVGILGGSAGTTLDTLTLLHRSAECGAWVALFGRKINLSESPLDTLRLMRAVVEGDIKPAEGVVEYHRALKIKGLVPHRSIAEDNTLTDPVLLAEK